MKKEKIFAAAAACTILLAIGFVTAWAQGYTGSFRGKVTKNNQPANNLHVICTDPRTGRQFKTKTDKNGEFVINGLQPGAYVIEVMGDKKEVLYSKTSGVGADVTDLPIDLSNPAASGGTAGGQPFAEGQKNHKKLTKEEQAAQKADAAKLTAMNGLIQQAQTAMQAQNWAEAETALKQLIADDPNTTRWEFYKALGDSQRNEQHPQDAIQSYEKGIQVATAVASGTAPKDPHNPNPDPARAKAGAGQMLNAEGGIYVQMNNNDKAIAVFKRAAEVDPNPGMAYYNLCAMEFNSAKYDDAADACGKSVAADPSRADAWFFQGAALSKAGKGAAAAQALNKYLQLDPNGPHAAEAKQMLAQK